MKYKLKVNGTEHNVEVEPDMPLLWVIRDVLGLTGTKFGCGQALCGACTVHLDGNAVRSCITPVSAAADAAITTIEGLSAEGTHPLQKEWIESAVPQCGYCQPGQIMQAAAALKGNKKLSEEDVNTAMAGNLCRCGTYLRIRNALRKVSGVRQ